MAVLVDAGILDLIQKRNGDVVTTTHVASVEAVHNVSMYQHPENMSQYYNFSHNLPSVHLEKFREHLNTTLMESESDFANKLSQTLNLLEDIRLGNTTLNQTINEMSTYVNNIVDEIDESFFMLVRAFKERLDSQVELARQHALELVLNAKDQAIVELKSLQEQIESI